MSDYPHIQYSDHSIITRRHWLLLLLLFIPIDYRIEVYTADLYVYITYIIAQKKENDVIFVFDAYKYNFDYYSNFIVGDQKKKALGLAFVTFYNRKNMLTRV